MAENNYNEILEKYALPKLKEYSKIVENLLARHIVATVGSFYENERQRQWQVNRERFDKLKAGSLEALVILEGNKEKFEACLDLALSRNHTVDRHGPYADGYLTLLTSINVDSFCSEVKSFAYLLEEKEQEDYLKSQLDKALACELPKKNKI